MPSTSDLSRSRRLRLSLLVARPRPRRRPLAPPGSLTSYATTGASRRAGRRWQAAFVAAALLLLALPGLTLLMEPRATTSDSEQRALAPWPPPPAGWQELRLWPAAAEAWLEDHLGGRPTLLSLAAGLRLWLREPGMTSVVFGEADWLFLRGAARLRLAFGGPPPDGAAWAETLSLFKRWGVVIQAAGARPLVLVVPDKETLETQRLPWWARRFDSEARLDAMLAALRAGLCDCVLDLRAALRAGGQGPALYWPRDTHWTPYGAYLAYRALVDRLRAAWPALPLAEGTAVTWGPATKEQDLWRLLGFATPLLLSLPDQPAPARPPVALDEPAGAGPPPRGPRLLVIGDSFRLALAPWLAESFGELTVEALPAPAALARRLAAHPSDLVVIVVVERNLYGQALPNLMER